MIEAGANINLKLKGAFKHAVVLRALGAFTRDDFSRVSIIVQFEYVNKLFELFYSRIIKFILQTCFISWPITYVFLYHGTHVYIHNYYKKSYINSYKKYLFINRSADAPHKDSRITVSTNEIAVLKISTFNYIEYRCHFGYDYQITNKIIKIFNNTSP